MKVTRRVVVLGGLGALTLAGGLTTLLGAERRTIARLLTTMVKAATQPTANSRRLLLAGLDATVGVSFENESQEDHDREQLVTTWLEASSFTGPLFVELRELEMGIEESHARVSGEALVSQSQHDDIHARVQPFVVHLVKRNGDWRVSAVRVDRGAPALPEARP